MNNNALVAPTDISMTKILTFHAPPRFDSQHLSLLGLSWWENDPKPYQPSGDPNKVNNNALVATTAISMTKILTFHAPL